MRNAFTDALVSIAEQNPDIWLLTGDLGYSVLEPFETKYPDRFINVGVAEQNLAGIAAGIAHTGKHVVAYSIGTFCTMRCFEQIRNDICYHNLPVTLVGVGGGYAYGTQGFSHHVTEDLALMRALPNMTVAAPCDLEQAKKIAPVVLNHAGPSYVRIEKTGGPKLHPHNLPVEFGKVVELKAGKEVLLIGTGTILEEAMLAAATLKGHGIDAAIWSVPYIKPMDETAIRQAKVNFKLIVTIEEHQLIGGLGSAVAEAFSAAPPSFCQLVRLGVADLFLTEGYSQAAARKHLGLDAANIAGCVLRSVPHKDFS